VRIWRGYGRSSGRISVEDLVEDLKNPFKGIDYSLDQEN
jgi:hypothetical protein